MTGLKNILIKKSISLEFRKKSFNNGCFQGKKLLALEKATIISI